MKVFTEILTYVKGIVSEPTGNPSSRRIFAAALVVDFIINVHHSVAVLSRITNLIYMGKAIGPETISAISTNLTQIVMVLGIEAGLIGGLLGLTTLTSMKSISKSE